MFALLGTGGRPAGRARPSSTTPYSTATWTRPTSSRAWFRDERGGKVRFTGNEGSGEETEYACYVLVVGRRGPAGAKEQPDSESGRATGRTEWTGRTGRTEWGQPPGPIYT